MYSWLGNEVEKLKIWLKIRHTGAAARDMALSNGLQPSTLKSWTHYLRRELLSSSDPFPIDDPIQLSDGSLLNHAGWSGGLL